MRRTYHIYTYSHKSLDTGNIKIEILTLLSARRDMVSSLDAISIVSSKHRDPIHGGVVLWTSRCHIPEKVTDIPWEPS